jgi:hypothetical protein
VLQSSDTAETLRNQNYIHEEIKSGLNLGNVCYHSVQNILPSLLLSTNLNIKMYKNIVFSFVLYECRNLISLLEERTWHRLTVFWNRELKGMFGLKGGSGRRLENTT